MISWMNNNQGFVMCLLTAVYVIATIIIVYYNRKSINEIKETREAESRPYVFANLISDARDMCFYLQVKNYGKTGAKILELSIEPNLKINSTNNNTKFIENTILAPSQVLQFIVIEERDKTAESSYKVKIEYESLTSSMKKYTEEYELNVQYIDCVGHTDSNASNLSKTENYLKRISEHLDSIRMKVQ
ncbi:hypothetical protein [[Clostridium] fimetarium]|uniref:Uncharacterized protein n=1 Tax=[Clostridium] fimetarium TaxID=99656 RepID=A0A1I0RDH7_9FIRM|nr:hypothetical protein [[Clostridium] fimetarium]SEW38868.1 hypothetical protein SAMN05421659_11454 [[Clostridium] fimetarium]